MKRKYSIGLDFGTLSARALIVDICDGTEISTAVCDYSHGVIERELPCGKTLPIDYALQYPQDYIDVLKNIIPVILNKSGVDADDVIGIGIDFTASTVMPVKADGTPLCFLDRYKENPHSYVKLWKHHAAQDKANKITEIAYSRGEKWLEKYGGKISSELALPKLWQILDEAPEIYYEMDCFIEASDWIVWQLCGVQTRNSCAAGYKSLWNKRDGYPSKEFFKALDVRLENVIDEKFNCEVSPLGIRAGGLTKAMSKLTGLKEGTSVAVGIIDAHASMPAVKIDREGKMLAIIGTSTCHLLISKDEYAVDGIFGVVEDGIMPGYFAYEAGQSCVGDHFAWFIENCLPKAYYDEAKIQGKNIYDFLNEKASAIKVGQSGLIALDWWNGNRSVLVNSDLSGLLIGMTLLTKPEEIYRALIEATAFGTKTIIETFKQNGVKVNEFYAAGGISQKNPLMMQIYSDVINMPVYIAGSEQSGALGSAIFGAVVGGGYSSIFDAASAMGRLKNIVYYPNAENVSVYKDLYNDYSELHDYFGRGGSDIMKRLKERKSYSASLS